MAHQRDDRTRATHPDPITGEHGAHPTGVGLGTTGGAVTGAALGSAGGPLGAVLGAIVGGIAGAMAGKAIAETFDPTLEDAYWKANYLDQPQIPAGADQIEAEPGLHQVWELRSRCPATERDLVELYPAEVWNDAKSRSELSWEKTRHAAQESWIRAGRSISDRQIYC